MSERLTVDHSLVTELVLLRARLELAGARLELERDQAQERADKDAIGALTQGLVILTRVRNDVQAALKDAAGDEASLDLRLEGPAVVKALRGMRETVQQRVGSPAGGASVRAELEVVWAELEALRQSEQGALKRLAELQRRIADAD